MYKNRVCGDSLSMLGLGMMRLPKNEDGSINKNEVFDMVDLAMKNGINYFDTAYVYHGGTSENVTGEALSRYPRESYRVATKFPGFGESYFTRIDEIFNEQLEKTGLKYFDYYLFHNVDETNIDLYLDEKYGICDYLFKKKEEGVIKHLGFSCHAEFDGFKKFVDAIGEHLEFCQLQINYIDWSYQEARKKIEYLNGIGMPVWVMEPLRGGKLAKDDKEIEKITGMPSIESAFAFIQTIPGIKMILSGMSNMEQLKYNINVFEDRKTLERSEFEAMVEYGRKIAIGVPCTGCRYCVDGCPMGIEIPEMIKLYNKSSLNEISKKDLAAAIDVENGPKSCLGCGACESVCPQKIGIPKLLSELCEKVK